MDRILIVDDQATIRRLLCLSLELAGYEVLEASCGEDALTRAAVEVPHAILLDYTMPGMDGIATALALRADSTTADIPIILMSAGIRLREYREQALVNGTLPKPFSLEAVHASLEAVLQHPA